MITIKDMTDLGRGEIEQILRFALGRLGVDGVTVAVYANDRMLDRFSSGGIQYEAMLQKSPLVKTYCLYLRESCSEPLENILCHEAVHLHQQECGDLVFDSNHNDYLWKGKEYPSSVPYEFRPWEVEAFKMDASLANDYRKSNKPKKRGCIFKKLKQ